MKTMRNSSPAINMEYILKKTDFIVFETDLKGGITYVNEDFLRISGLDKDELMGVSNNIVRHSDMPVEVLADLWGSLKRKRAWTGMVKNRCKNGGYYWVVEDVTPIYENGQCTAYMSVCSKPLREDVEVYEHIYSLFRDGCAGDLRIKNGEVVKSSLLGKLSSPKDSRIKFRMLVAISVMALMVIAYWPEVAHFHAG